MATNIPDDLYLGGLTGGPTAYDPNTTSNPMQLGPGGLGVGPMGRVYIWDTVPLTLNASNVAGSQTPAGAANLTLAAGTGTTSAVNGRGETVIRLDVPRAIRVTQAGAGTQRIFTVTGYDYTGQKMSEAITSSVGSTANGKKAFKDVLSIAVSGATTTACNVGTNDVLGSPVKIGDAAYVCRAGWADTLAEDAGTLVDADATTPATTTTGDVRGTYVPSSATNGTRRLVMAIAIPAAGSGPNATRSGAYGVNQNLA